MDRRTAYDQRNGLATKSYKLNKDIADQFKEACKERGTSQAKELTRMMQAYIQEGR